MGQILLARRMGKKRIIAETGAGQHGVATATVCALFDMPCVVYMGSRSSINIVLRPVIRAHPSIDGPRKRRMPLSPTNLLDSEFKLAQVLFADGRMA